MLKKMQRYILMSSVMFGLLPAFAPLSFADQVCGRGHIVGFEGIDDLVHTVVHCDSVSGTGQCADHDKEGAGLLVAVERGNGFKEPDFPPNHGSYVQKAGMQWIKVVDDDSSDKDGVAWHLIRAQLSMAMASKLPVRIRSHDKSCSAISTSFSVMVCTDERICNDEPKP